MGLLKTIGGALGTAADIATDFIPGQFDDKLVDTGINIAKRAFGSGSGPSSGAPSSAPPPPPRRTGGSRTSGRGRGRSRRRAPRSTGSNLTQQDDDPVISTSPIDLGAVEVNPGAAFGKVANMLQADPPSGGAMTTTSSGGMLAQSFQGALGQMMLKKSIRSKSGRAILEAMQSGALQNGLIQRTTTVETPRGTENHSPPGFRTIYINEMPFAVFKPLASALRLLPKETTSKITAADMKAIRKSDRLTKKIKKLAKKTGNLKVTNK